MEMKIHFCDLCNESVPQSDLDLGRAVLRNGRVICVACEAAMSVGLPAERPAAPAGAERAEPAVPSPGRASGAPAGSPVAVVAVGLALSAVALIVALGCAAFFFLRFERRMADFDSRASAQRAEEEVRSRNLEGQVATLAEERKSQLAAAREERATLERRLEDLERARAGSSGELGESLARLEERLDELEGLRESVDQQGNDLSQLEKTATSLRTDLRRLGERVEAAESAATPAEDPGKASPSSAAAPKESGDAAWLPWVSDLKSPNSGTRWQAVQSLGGTGDPAVAPHLAPMLKDGDIFVRMAAARILGDLAVVGTIPALIDALEDEEASVREAALVSLRAVSGQSIAFDPVAREAERAKRVKAWREWWEQASKELLGPAKGKPKG